MKSFTDIEQSKKLAKILPFKSADMAYMAIIEDYMYPQKVKEYRLTIKDECFNSKYDIPAWSLAALLIVYPMVVDRDMDMYCCWQNSKNLHSRHYDNPIDARVEMILKLHKEKLL